LSHFNPPKINSACDFGQLFTLIANVFKTDRDIEKRKKALLTTIPPVFDKNDAVNFGPLTTKFTCLKSQFDPPKITTARARSCLGHVMLQGAEFQLPNCLPSWTRQWRGWPHIGFCPKFLVFPVTAIVSMSVC